jgi:ESS family glutamate:Na+ symporter
MHAWDFVMDFALAAALLLLAKWLRVHFRIIQRLFNPPSVIAGLIGLALGPFGFFRAIPFSPAFTSYAGILITVVFAAIGLTTVMPHGRRLVGRVGNLWAFGQTSAISQWMVALATAAALTYTFWPNLSWAFGLVMPAGFLGGHGTAAAMGQSFSLLGWPDGLALGLTSATVGIFLSVVVGIGILNYAVCRGWIGRLQRFQDLSREAQRGLVPPDQQKEIARSGVSPTSLDVLALHGAIILVVAGAAYLASQWLSSLGQYVSVPAFACAFLVGLVGKVAISRSGAGAYLDNRLFSHCAGAATDFLIIFGIASIKPSIIVEYAAPLSILIAVGLLQTLVMVFYVAPRMMGKGWFDRAVFSFGWMTGTVAMGILLLRISDPELKGGVLEDYAIANIPGAVVDLTLIAALPFLLLQGYGLYVFLALAAYLAFVQVVAIFLRRAEADGT